MFDFFVHLHNIFGYGLYVCFLGCGSDQPLLFNFFFIDGVIKQLFLQWKGSICDCRGAIEVVSSYSLLCNFGVHEQKKQFLFLIFFFLF